MKGFGKKSEVGMTVIVVVIILFLFLGWYINLNRRECNGNRDCGGDSYCGSDYSCHTFPIIQKTVVQYNLLIPSLILGIAIVLASIIFRRSGTHVIARPSQESEIKETETLARENIQEVEEITEPYYKSEGGIRVP